MFSRILVVTLALLGFAGAGKVAAQPIAGHKDRVQQVAFSPDGKLLASASWDKSVRLWNVASGKEVLQLAGHTLQVEAVAFSPDGKLLASASRDKTVRLWDVATGKLLHTLASHEEPVSAVAFSPDGKWLASGDQDGIVRLWDRATRKELVRINLDTALEHLSFSPDGSRLATVGGNQVTLWDPASGKQHLAMAWSPGSAGDCIAFSPDGNKVVSGHCHWNVWDTTTGKQLRQLEGAAPGGHKHGLAFSPDGRVLVTANAEGQLHLWNPTTGALIREWKQEKSGITSVTFSPDGTRLAWACEDGSIHVGNAPEPRSRGPRPPFVPTPQDVVEKMLDLADVKKTDTVVDLGCGDGRIVVTAAQKYGCKGIGYDLDKECLRLARENVKKNQLEEGVQIVEEDIFNVDLSKVDVVTLYLFPTSNVKLIPQFEKMKPGSRIVSHAADMKGVVPDKVITVKSKDDEQERKLYLWTLPLKKAEPSK